MYAAGNKTTFCFALIIPPEVFYKKGVLKKFAKLVGKHLSRSPFFKKVAVVRPATLSEKESPTQIFSCEFREAFKNTCFAEHLRMIALECGYLLEITDQ